MDNTYTLNIAGFLLGVTCEDEWLYQQICTRYRLYRTHAEAQFQISVRRENSAASKPFPVPEITFQNNQVQIMSRGFSGSYDLLDQRAYLLIKEPSPLGALDYFLRVMFAVIVFRAGGMMVHGAGIRHQGSGHLFIGHSGSGKTTVARVSVKDEVLNDDLVALMRHESSWRIYSTPFWNSTQVEPQPLTAPLVGLYRLIQDRSVFLEPLKPSHAVAELVANIPVISANPDHSGPLLERCARLLYSVPMYSLHFLPDDSFWQVIDG